MSLLLTWEFRSVTSAFLSNSVLWAAADAAEALAAIAGLESRVSRVEDGLFENITGNPYLVQFDSLEGVVMTKGIWNAERNRIEC